MNKLHYSHCIHTLTSSLLNIRGLVSCNVILLASFDNPLGTVLPYVSAWPFSARGSLLLEKYGKNRRVLCQ